MRIEQGERGGGREGRARDWAAAQQKSQNAQTSCDFLWPSAMATALAMAMAMAMALPIGVIVIVAIVISPLCRCQQARDGIREGRGHCTKRRQTNVAAHDKSKLISFYLFIYPSTDSVLQHYLILTGYRNYSAASARRLLLVRQRRDSVTFMRNCLLMVHAVHVDVHVANQSHHHHRHHHHHLPRLRQRHRGLPTASCTFHLAGKCSRVAQAVSAASASCGHNCSNCPRLSRGNEWAVGPAPRQQRHPLLSGWR